MRSPKEILEYASSVAVVGASRDPNKPAGSVPIELKRHGFRIIPVNPNADVLFGERVYKVLAEIPGKVDVVQVFRPSEEAAEITRQAAAIGARAVWLQLGIHSEEARRIAESAGLDFVEDRCMAVERSLHGIEKQPELEPVDAETEKE